MKRLFIAALASAALMIVIATTGRAAAPPCDPNNGGITLPRGFCAAVVADDVGAARHLVVTENGDLFVSTRNGRGQTGGVVALRDTNGDGRMDTRQKLGDNGGTGIALRNGYLYYATTTSVLRHKMTPGVMMPAAAAETIVRDLPDQRSHAEKGIAFDGRGGLYVNVGAPSNACQQPDREAKVPGQDPCPLLEKHGGIWRFDENTPGQTQAAGKRFATGLRQMIGLAWHDNALWIVMHNRDGLDTLWPGQFTAAQNADWPAEYLVRATEGSNFGWPYCFYSTAEKKLVTNPEYGGDGKKSDRCGAFTPPVVGFPGHWAPNDLLFYTGTQFPSAVPGRRVRRVSRIVESRAAAAGRLQRDVRAVLRREARARSETFADGFAGRTPLLNPDDAAARPGGVAMGPDGSLYIAEDVKGRIWRVMYRGN